MVKRKTEFSRMWLVDSTMMKNLNTTSSHSKVNNHVNFSLTKPSDEIQYKTIDRIPWREEQERSSSSKKPTIFDTQTPSSYDSFHSINQSTPSSISEDVSGFQPLNTSQYSINNTPQSSALLPTPPQQQQLTSPTTPVLPTLPQQQQQASPTTPAPAAAAPSPLLPSQPPPLPPPVNPQAAQRLAEAIQRLPQRRGIIIPQSSKKVILPDDDIDMSFSPVIPLQPPALPTPPLPSDYPMHELPPPPPPAVSLPPPGAALPLPPPRAESPLPPLPQTPPSTSPQRFKGEKRKRSIQFYPSNEHENVQNEPPRASFSRLESLAMASRPPNSKRISRTTRRRPEVAIAAPPPKGVRWKAKADKRTKEEVAGIMGENRRKTKLTIGDGRAHEYNPDYKGTIRNNKGKTFYYCLICNKKYQFKHQLGQHMTKVHRKYNTVFKRYSLKDNQAKTNRPLKDLVKRQNKAADKIPEKKFRKIRGTGSKEKVNKLGQTACLLCNKKYSSKAYLKNHYKTDHPFFKLNPNEKDAIENQIK